MKAAITIAILIALLLVGCSTTKSDGLKTKALGDSSASVRVGMITTYDETGKHIIDVCGTAEAPCEESTSVGGEGSDAAWKTAWEAVKMIAIVVGFAFGR